MVAPLISHCIAMTIVIIVIITTITSTTITVQEAINALEKTRKTLLAPWPAIVFRV